MDVIDLGLDQPNRQQIENFIELKAINPIKEIQHYKNNKINHKFFIDVLPQVISVQYHSFI